MFQSNFCDDFKITGEILSRMKYVSSLYLQQLYFYFILNSVRPFDIYLCVYNVLISCETIVWKD